MISACELSGDMYGASLVKELKKQNSSLNFVGLGGSRMAEAGVELVADITTSSTIGFLEPLRHIPKIYSAYRKMKRLMKIDQPDLLVIIDAQGFHIPLLAAAKKLNIPTVYYIAPQEWQWGTDAGGRKVLAVVDKILAIFEEEHEFYKRLGGDSIYVGHPILDELNVDLDREALQKKIGVKNPERVLAVFPGSRPQEIKRVAPILIKAAAEIQKKDGVQVVISVSSSKYEKAIKKIVEENNIQNPILYKGMARELISITDLSLVVSGTITLEHAVLGVPCVVGYKFAPISFRLAKLFFGARLKRIKYISLPNLLMMRPIIPEFLQEEATVANLVFAANNLLEDGVAKENLKKNLVKVKKKLGELGVVKRAALEIINYMNRENNA